MSGHDDDDGLFVVIITQYSYYYISSIITNNKRLWLCMNCHIKFKDLYNCKFNVYALLLLQKLDIVSSLYSSLCRHMKRPIDDSYIESHCGRCLLQQYLALPKFAREVSPCDPFICASLPPLQKYKPGVKAGSKFITVLGSFIYIFANPVI